jgi:hypothetical protein
MTQGKSERWHRTLKNRILLDFKRREHQEEIGRAVTLRGDEMETGRLQIVWTSDSFNEMDWIRFLLGPMRFDEMMDKRFESAVPYSLYVVNSNHNPLHLLPKSFYDNISRQASVGLLHMADEWFGEDYNYYRNFSFVIKTHYTRRLQHAGIMTIPLGFSNETNQEGIGVPASQRLYLWCFLGNNSAGSRPEMLRTFHGISSQYPIPTSNLKKSDYDSVLRQTKFCPAPMGNVMIETWRTYEAIENGCIPLVESRIFCNYYRDLFGHHPIPTFSNWRQARVFAKELSCSPPRLDALQAEIFSWWQGEKIYVRDKMIEFTKNGLRGHYKPDLENFRFLSSPWRNIWQYSELVRHHSVHALARRLLKTIIRRGKVYH